MTRKDQVSIVSHIAGITTAQARLALDALGGIIMAGLLEEEKIVLPGVGSFTVQRRSPRNVVNPQTGMIMELPATAVIKFKPAPGLRESVKERHS